MDESAIAELKQCADDWEIEWSVRPRAFDVAIELMRAAAPKDAAAEREHCDEVAEQLAVDEHHAGKGGVSMRVERERAQARAEGYAAACQRAVETAQELDNARATYARERQKHREQLAAAQAEVERLRAESWEALHSYRTLETTLEALREASERYIAWADGGDKQAREFRAAIEASRVSR